MEANIDYNRSLGYSLPILITLSYKMEGFVLKEVELEETFWKCCNHFININEKFFSSLAKIFKISAYYMYL